MDRAALASWLITRLTGDRAQEEWRLVFAMGARFLLRQPLAEIVPRPTFARALDSVLDNAEDAAGAAPILRHLLAPIMAELASDTEPLQRWCPEEVQMHVETIIGQEGFVDETWIDILMTQEATRALFAEALVQGLDEFAEMIPQMVQGLAPSGLGRLAARLQEAAGGVSERFRDEMRRRLEPEVRRFAEQASQRLMESTFTTVKAKLDEPSYKEVRINLFRHALSRSPASYGIFLSPTVQSESVDAVVAWAGDENVRRLVRSGLLGVYERICETQGDQSVSALMNLSEPTLPIDSDEWADRSWPVVQKLLLADELRPVFGQFAEDLLQFITEKG